MSVEEHAKAIFEEVQKSGNKTVTYEEVETKFKNLIDNFMLDEATATETLRSGYKLNSKGASKVMTIAEVQAAGLEQAKKNAASGEKNGVFVTVKAKVTQIFPNNKPEMIQQAVVIADSTGSAKLTVWVRKPYANSKNPAPVTQLPLLEEGKCYEFRSVVTTEWQGRVNLKTTGKVTEFVAVDEDIEVHTGEQELVAPVVAIYEDSGLIRRCTVSVDDPKGDVKKCGRAYIKGECPDHGKQSSEFDVVIRGVLDDGNRTQNFTLNAELVKQTTGLTVESAKAIIAENPDSPGEMVQEEIRKKLMNRYFHVKGNVSSKGNMFVKEITAPDNAVDVPALKAKLDAVGGQ